MDNIPISAGELKAKNDNVIPDVARKLGNKSFWYYTRLTTADQILDGKSFWVGSITAMNDLDELELHKREKEKIYALCFCNSESEKIPMWYLYSGVAGKGAALGLTPGTMLAFLRSLVEVEGVKEDGNKDILKIGGGIELRFGWVYYRKQAERKHILFKNKWYEVRDVSAFEKDNYFIKNYPWEYEKEFRLIFINHTGTTYKRLIVTIPDSVHEKIKLRLAPELKFNDLKKNKELKYIRRIPESALVYSNLKIRMNLFSRNKESLTEYLSEEFTKKDPDVTPEELCQLIEDASRCKKATP